MSASSSSPLFVRLPNHLGDACMTLPALDLLAHTGFDLTLAGRPWAASLFAAYPWRIVGTDSAAARDARRTIATDAARAAGRANAALLFTNSFSSAFAARFAGFAPVGYARDARSWLLHTAVPVPPRWHTVTYYYDLAATFISAQAPGRAVAPCPPAIELRLTDAARAGARALLDAAGVRDAYVVLCPVAVGLHHGRVKAWADFPKLCAVLLQQNVRVVACPGPGERTAVETALPGATVLPEADLGTFAALLAAARLVVANDSGPGHLAAAVGAPLVSVFGVTEPDQTRPWGPRVKLVGGARAWPRFEDVWSAARQALRLA